MRLAVRAAVLGALVCASYARPASAQQTHVLIITGLSAEPQYKAVFLRTAATLADSARLRWKVADSSLIVLGEDPADDPKHIKGKSTKEEVANAFLRLSKRVAPGDVLLVFLNGHGAGEGPGSRVNLPGPDPTAADYASWISGFARQTIVFVNAASGSGDFLPVLAGRGRIVVTATKTGIERNETVFAAPFVRGLTGTEADADKDGRVSIFEAFDFAKKEVARVYETDKKMLTEHAIMSDTILARRVSFGAPVSGADPKIAALVAERQALESQVADLRARKASTDSTVYAAQLEKLLLELAEKSQAIRAAGGKP
jgi:chorismate mutase